MPAGVPPRLKVIADDDAVEADFLGVDAELEQLAWPELLGRRLIAEPQLLHTNWGL